MAWGNSTDEYKFTHPDISNFIDIIVVEPPTAYDIYVSECDSLNDYMVQNNLTYLEFTERIISGLRFLNQKRNKSPKDITDICIGEGFLLKLDIMYA